GSSFRLRSLGSGSTERTYQTDSSPASQRGTRSVLAARAPLPDAPGLVPPHPWFVLPWTPPAWRRPTDNPGEQGQAAILRLTKGSRRCERVRGRQWLERRGVGPLSSGTAFQPADSCSRRFSLPSPSRRRSFHAPM